VPHILYLGTTPDGNPATRAFVARLHELGWRDGESVRLVYIDRVDELRLEGIDLIVSSGDMYTRAARSATGSVPIVMAVSTDPVGAGLIRSFAQPGGNVTGLSSTRDGMAEKRLDLLRELLPGMGRVAVLWDPASPFPGTADLRETQGAAAALGLQLDLVPLDPALGLNGVTAAMRAIPAESEALVVVDSLTLLLSVGTIAALALDRRLPSIYPWRRGAERGGLLAYAVSTDDLFRRAAEYADRILRGATPAELPVEQPRAFDFTINRTTAQALGLIIPPALLAQATEVLP
jgi:putative ABC transport system substrate-binding protein